jgi:hypothetical protein
MRNLRRARGDAEPADPGDIRGWLRTGDAGRAEEADGEDDREKDSGDGRIAVTDVSVGVERLDPGDPHDGGTPPGMSRYSGSRCPGSGLTVAPWARNTSTTAALSGAGTPSRAPSVAT